MQIYLSHVSIRETLEREQLPLIDLPHFVKRNGFGGVALPDRLLERCDRSAVRGLVRSCVETNCGFILDVNSDLTYADDTAWLREIEHVSRMLDLAAELRAGAVRITVGGQSFSIQHWVKGRREARAVDPDSERPANSPVKKLLLSRTAVALSHAVRRTLPPRVARQERKTRRAVQALERIVPLAARRQTPLAVENHWGITSRPADVVRLIREIDSPHLGTCPDFGNFPRGVDRYEGLALLAPRALNVHARVFRFDGRGEEATIDYARCLGILKESGYDGTLTVEQTAPGDDLDNSLQARKLILKHW